MVRAREEILKDLSNGVLKMDEELTVQAAQESVETGFDAYDAISNGLVVGMNKAGELYERGEYFVPEILICSDAMYAGLDILKPYLKKEKKQEKIGCVIGVVEGDTHDIGKNLVKIMLETADFDVYDLGRNVSLNSFIEKAKEADVELICMSTLMTTTMGGMGTVVEMLNEEGTRDRFKVLVGGGPITQAFAERIGADGYAENATAAVKIAKKICAEKTVKI